MTLFSHFRMSWKYFGLLKDMFYLVVLWKWYKETLFERSRQRFAVSTLTQLFMGTSNT